MTVSDQTSRELTEITTLYESTRALASSSNLRECLHAVMEILAQRQHMYNGTVSIMSQGTAHVEIEVAHGMSDKARKKGRYQVGEGITGRVVASGSPIVVPRISEEPLFLNRTKSRGDISARTVSFLCVPIKHGPQTIGALSVDKEYKPEVDLDKDVRFLLVLSGLIAQTVMRIIAVNKEKKKLEQENRFLRRELGKKYRIGNLVSNSSRMQEVFEMIQRVADSNATILLRGESGTGKTLVAKAIHYNSQRSSRPCITVNCAALPETLLESELFGYEKGLLSAPMPLKRAVLNRRRVVPFFLMRSARSVTPFRSSCLRSSRSGSSSAWVG